jgi:thymidylate synthase (FAD)
LKIIRPSHEILSMPEGDSILKLIELSGRTCYKSEDRITSGSAVDFIKRLIAAGHLSVIEHVSITVRFVCDRGVSHELVRHRLASFSQESTRYANYSKDKFSNEITLIRPCFWAEGSPHYSEWLTVMKQAEESYMKLLSGGASPQEARSVLPNSLKTEMVMTCNIREWRHVLNLRCSRAAHPQMREIMLPLLEELHARVPVLFEDLYEEYREDIARLKETY